MDPFDPFGFWQFYYTKRFLNQAWDVGEVLKLHEIGGFLRNYGYRLGVRTGKNR
jgi:hypothetical protein